MVSRQTMASFWTFLFISLGCLISQLECTPTKRPVFKDDDCMEPIPLGMESGKIPDGNIWASTSGNKRPPSNGRLGRHSGAWSASTPNGEQFLAIDLGRRYIVTAVATQGRQGTEEYVAEFMLETSDDNSTWRVYTTELGIDEIFTGNKNGQDVKKNTLEFPIRARYIRFRPWRWSSSMSMRVEIFGCAFVGDVGYFDGKSHISYDLSNLPVAIHTVEDILRIHFKTNRPNGILFYTDGNQGDYLALELKRGYLYLHIDLGSTRLVRGGTTLVGGSMLDDHQWHDVLVQRKGKDITLLVDRLETKGEAAGDFFRLDLDSKLFVGGIPTFTKPGVTVRYNFYGCIENAQFNGVKIIRDAREKRERFSVYGLIAYECQLENIVPLTFPTISSGVDVTGDSSGVGSGTVRASLDFRTHNTDGLIFYHKFVESGFVKVSLNSEGYVAYRVESQTGQIVEDIIRNNDVESPTKSFSDGLWHTLSLSVDTEKVNCTVDRNSIVSSRKLVVKAGNEYHLGGRETDVGFVGCMRHLDIANLPNDNGLPRGATMKGVTIGTCSIRDRCTPNPCENNGVCYQTWSTFKCNCETTGYRGAVCHISAHHLSCRFYKMQNQNQKKEKIKIDLDGSGPLKPFEVLCSKTEADKNSVFETEVGHNSENPVTVNGYEEPGSYVRRVRYDATTAGLNELVERATSCEQFISYKCTNSKLFAKPPDSKAETYGWWVGRTFQPMYYWGKAAPGSKKCECGLTANGCVGSSTTCNCDAGLATQKVDSGLLRHKEYLPVLELHFGDTGTVTDNKVGVHQLGKLRCRGDNLFENVVTFRKPDGVIKFPTFEAKSSGDIWFQFKTTVRDGVMIHCVGEKDYIRVEIYSGNTIKFRFDAGDGERALQIRTAAGLNDDRWHTVHVERNRKQAWLKVDTQGEEVWDEPPEQGPRTMDLSSPLVVGAAVGYQDGFVGCIRGLMVNGVLLDMRGMVARGEVTYGVSEGCVGKCSSSPCFNGGTCYEGYSSYTCDCSYTPFRGWMCGREVGANMVPSHMITYKFDATHGLSATDFDFAQIGFSTAKMQGILMQIRNAENSEYISVEINNHGGVKMAFDIGYGRDELNTENNGISYANNQQHVVTIHITKRGRHIKMQVDNYEPAIKVVSVDESADTILNNPTIMYIGRNDTTPLDKGFEGCIYRMQVQNIFPLKRVFQDPRPSYVTLTPAGMIREDMCGFEEITQAPDPVETRPPDDSLVNITYPVTFEEGMALYERVIVGVVLALFLLILIIVLYIVCYHTRQKGDYETKEAKGADLADNPDMAVMYNQEGLPIPKRKEWFV